MTKPSREFHTPPPEGWRPTAVEGVSELTLATDPASGLVTRLVRLAPGAHTRSVGAFIHDFHEEAYILAGSVRDLTLDEEFPTGCYANRAEGMAHGPIESVGGCLVLEVRYPVTPHHHRHPAATCQLSVARQVIAPDSLPTPFGVWSPAVLTGPGRLLFLSGLTARRPDGSLVGEGDIAAQTEQVCKNLRATCVAAGGDLSDIASVTVYVRDIRNFTVVHAIRAQYFPTEPPASAMVEIASLVDPLCLIEISAIAVLPATTPNTATDHGPQENS